VTFPLALRAHAGSALVDADAVSAWTTSRQGDEPKLDRETLVRAIRKRRSVRGYADKPLPRDELADLLRWAEAPIPADAPPVVRQLVTVASVDGLEQEHPRDAAVNVFQVGDLEAIVERLGDRGYRWAQLEAGIRAGRLQIGAFMRGWGAAASTFYDEEVSRLLDTHESPLLMVAVGPR